MCGIVGILKDGLGKSKEKLLIDILAPLSHRGPDAWGLYATSQIGLGHLRLSIIDLQNGHQPMRSRNSSIVFNGEIYNYIELRKELQACGRSFVTTSDTEVVQTAIEAWGVEAALEKFNGQFAFLFWDKRSKQLIAARDRFGIRPLYYLRWDGGFFFASEMKAFDAIAGFNRRWHPQHLLLHGLLWNTLGSDTVFEGIESLPPGHFAVFSHQEKTRQVAYYDIGLSEPDRLDDFEDCKRIFKEQLKDSVRLRLRSDVPVGCYLSGGIDSSVTSFLVQEVQKERFKTFSVAFIHPAYDESIYQNEMVAMLGSDHVCQTIDLDHINKHFLDAAYHFERPVFRTAPLPLYLLSDRVRREGIKVVLTGEAADEILCGYDVFKEIQLLRMWENGARREKIIEIIKNLYPHLSHYKKGGKLGFLEMYYEGFLGKIAGPPAGLAIRIQNNQVLANYLNKDWKTSIDLDQLESRLEAMIPSHVRDWPLLRRHQYLEMKTLLSGYLLSSQGDRMAMAHSVEGRFPFLDHRLVDWAFHLPDRFKLRGLESKHLLKEAFRDALPDMIVNRPKQPYMAPDLVSFIRNGCTTDQAGYFLESSRIKDYGIFDSRMVERLLLKLKRRKTSEIGYRDNMLITFILSAQMAEYWIRNPKLTALSDNKRTVRDLE
jgi:asparagine synthase (glutamine-hydrolysing)